jgi:hypothetical protein
MGRGSSGATAGVTKLIGADKKPIELDVPLQYGGISGLSSGAIDRIAPLEKSTMGEWQMVFNEDGIITDFIKGKKITDAQFAAMRNADVRSIKHTAKAGALGGTFSAGEINNFGEFNNQVLRAAAKEGTYCISKGKGFNAAGLKAYYAKACADAEKKYNTAVRKAFWKSIDVEIAHKEGRATHAEVARARRALKDAERKAYNSMLVEQHNALRAGQKRFGYTYSLEKRRS